MYKKILKKIIVIIFGLPFVFIIRIFSPILKIKIGFFYGERIGHLSQDAEIYLAEKSLNLFEKSYEFFFIGGKVSNKFLVTLIKRKIFISSFVSLIYSANRLIKGYEKYEYIPAVIRNYGSRDLSGVLPKTKPHLEFIKEENYKGKDFLKKIGCNKKFICLSIRDSAYLTNSFPENDFTYHDYRDSDINTYKKAINYLIDKDYFIIRMGKMVNDEFDITNSNFFDYAVSDKKEDFLDIWLMANCEFCVSTSTGLDNVSDIFRVPIVYVNALAHANFSSWNPRCIWVPKKIISKHDNKELSLNELIQNGAIGFPEKGTFQEVLDKNNLTFINNSEDEILDGVIEMHKKLNGIWKNSIEIENRQKVFWNRLKTWNRFKFNHNIKQDNPIGIISDTYLEKNKEWFLDEY